MSHLIRQAQLGDEITVIRPFSLCAKGERFSWDNARQFKVGERVEYLDFRPNNQRDWYDRADPLPAWLVEFESAGVVYEASDDLFATEEDLEGLREHLLRVFIEDEAKKLRRKPPRADITPEQRLLRKLADLAAPLVILIVVAGFIWLLCGLVSGCGRLGP